MDNNYERLLSQKGRILHVLYLQASFSESAYYLRARGFVVLLNIEAMKNLDLFGWQIRGMRSLAFSLRDLTIDVLTSCCQIPGMCNLAFSLREVTVNELSRFRTVKLWGFFFSVFWLLLCFLIPGEVFIKVTISPVINFDNEGVFHEFVCLKTRSVVANSPLEVWGNRLRLASSEWPGTSILNDRHSGGSGSVIELSQMPHKNMLEYNGFPFAITHFHVEIYSILYTHCGSNS